MTELDYRGSKVIAVQAWVAALPDRGTAILGETIEQAKATLREFERGNDFPAMSDIELQLRLIMATPDRMRRTELLSDWLKVWAHEQKKKNL
jgi:hypothetical protein